MILILMLNSGVLRVYCCSKHRDKSHLAEFRGSYSMPGLKPGSAACKKRMLPAVSSLLAFNIQLFNILPKIHLVWNIAQLPK